MTLRQTWVAAAVEALASAGVPDPMRDARLLLRWALSAPPEDVHQILRQEGTADEQTKFRTAIARRAKREPLSHIIGTRLFWDRAFQVSSAVLDPRPETETLIAEALHRGPFDRVLDLGTGSGCLLITLLAEWPEATGTGVDMSGAALAVARDNACRHDVAERCEWREGDWVRGLDREYDLIVSNPPYLADAELAEVSPEVRNFEPHAALLAGPDGLDAYRRIADTAGTVLAPHGLLMLEIGATQSETVSAVLVNAGWCIRSLIPDLDQRPRVIVAVL
ncbi:MAG: peptide chain release factor N(5)-glutamine methyltransferase [Paracoccaceae bacterium]